MFWNLIQGSNYWHPNVTIKAFPTRLRCLAHKPALRSLFSVRSWTTGTHPGQVFCLNMLSHVRRKRLNRFYSTPGIKSRFNHLPRRCSTTIKVSFLITFEQACTNPGRQVARTIRFCMAPSDIWGSSIWNWPCSPLGAWDFWGDSYTCGKFVHPCNWVITQTHVRSRLSRRTFPQLLSAYQPRRSLSGSLWSTSETMPIGYQTYWYPSTSTTFGLSPHPRWWWWHGTYPNTSTSHWRVR